MKKRRLNKEEVALWDQVAKTMQPLQPPKAAKISETKKSKSVSSKPKPTPSLDLFDLKAFEIGSKSQTALGQSFVTRRTGPKAPASKTTVQMDQKSFVKMRRGKLAPEARIDLHGMTLNQAHPALTQFILSSQRAGRRLVLVITGKRRTRRAASCYIARTRSAASTGASMAACASAQTSNLAGRSGPYIAWRRGGILCLP